MLGNALAACEELITALLRRTAPARGPWGLRTQTLALEGSPQQRAPSAPRGQAAGDADTGGCSALTSAPWQQKTPLPTVNEAPLQQRTFSSPQARTAAADAPGGCSPPTISGRLELLDGDERTAPNAMDGRPEAESGHTDLAASPRDGEAVGSSCKGEAAPSLCEGGIMRSLCVGEAAAASCGVEAAFLHCRSEGADLPWLQDGVGSISCRGEAADPQCGGEAAAAQQCQSEAVDSPDDVQAAASAALQGTVAHGSEGECHSAAQWEPCGSEAGSSRGCPGASSCGSDGGASAVLLYQAGQASNFSSILQHGSGVASAGAFLTPESRQGTLGAQTGARTDYNPTLTLPYGLSPLAVPATPAALPSWLDRPAQAVPEAGIMAWGPAVESSLAASHIVHPVPLSPPPTPAWLRATPVPGVAYAVLGAARGPPGTLGFSRLQGSATPVTGVAALTPRAAPELPSTPGTSQLPGCCGSGAIGASPGRVALLEAPTPGRTPGGHLEDSPSTRALFSGAPGSATAAYSTCEGYAASPGSAGGQPLALPDFRGFPTPLAACASGQASPARAPASSAPVPVSWTPPDHRQGAAARTLALSPEQGAMHVHKASQSAAVLGTSRTSPAFAQGAERSTLNASPDQGADGALDAPDIAERHLLGRLRAQLGSSPSPSPDVGDACARVEGAAAAAERRATFLRAIDRLQVCFFLVVPSCLPGARAHGSRSRCPR